MTPPEVASPEITSPEVNGNNITEIEKEIISCASYQYFPRFFPGLL
jgi:hypothetical protein